MAEALWTTLRSQLRAIETATTANLANLKQANVLAAQLVNETATLDKVGANLRAAYDNIERGTAEERNAISRAIELVSQLLALRQAEAEATAAVSASATEPRKRRKLSPAIGDEATPGSARESPAPQAAPTPPVPGPVAATRGAASRTSTPALVTPPIDAKPTGPLAAPSPKPSSAAGTPKPTSGNRKGQKPPPITVPPPPAPTLLEPGRKVAFRSTIDGEVNWVLGRIIKCIDRDKQRYEIEDDDVEEGNAPKRINLLIRSILPLPDPSIPDSQPQLSVGSTVLALFPDTTTFYRGRIAALPTPLTGRAASKRGQAAEVARSYKVIFADDDGQAKPIVPEMIILAPNSS